MGVQQRAGVPGPAQGGVHQDRAARLQRRREQGEDPSTMTGRCPAAGSPIGPPLSAHRRMPAVRDRRAPCMRPCGRPVDVLPGQVPIRATRGGLDVRLAPGK